jgi:hypothetical protein
MLAARFAFLRLSEKVEISMALLLCGEVRRSAYRLRPG